MQKFYLLVCFICFSTSSFADRYGLYEPEFEGPGGHNFFWEFFIGFIILTIIGYLWHKNNNDDESSIIINFLTGYNVFAVLLVIAFIILWGVENPLIVAVIIGIWFWIKD